MIEPGDPLLARHPPINQCARAVRRGRNSVLVNEKIEMIVSKNCGGAATYAKIAAARKLGIPVMMMLRPRDARRAAVEMLEQVTWLARSCHSPLAARGV